MTREEAINVIKGARQYLTVGNPIWNVKKVDEAMNMAIEALSADTVPYCSTREVSWSEPRTWHEKNSHTYICGDCGFEQAIYGNINEYNCCPRCGTYKEYVDYGGIFPQKRTPYRGDGEE